MFGTNIIILVKMRILIVLSIFCLALVASTKYNGSKVYQLDTLDQDDMTALMQLNSVLDFLSPLNKVGKSVDVVVPASKQKIFERFLKKQKINFIIKVENVEDYLEKIATGRQTPFDVKGKIDFEHYYRHADINSYLAELEKNYPDIVRLESIGKSYEGRNMTLIHISSGDSSNKPTFFLDAGIHAREWIAPAVALYVINQLVENKNNKNLIEDINWTILPSLNPDGYEYSWTDDRFWRKTRTPGKNTDCPGVDANRNFDFHWNEVGTDDWECSEIYAGPKAASEIEAQNLQNYLLNAKNVAVYLTLHSCGQYILYPWGWTSDVPDDWKELDDLAQRVNNAIQAVRGTEYTVGPITNTLYAAAGNSEDWSKGVANIDISYTIELPCGGFLGFDLPEEEILPVVTETWEGIKVMHDHIVSKIQRS